MKRPAVSSRHRASPCGVLLLLIHLFGAKNALSLQREVMRLRRKTTELWGALATLRRRAAGWKRVLETTANLTIRQTSVERLIVAQAIVACVGPWKTTKSYGMLDLSIAIATGRPPILPMPATYGAGTKPVSLPSVS